MIKRNYLNVVKMKNADAFWRIVPLGYNLPELARVARKGRFVRIDCEDEEYEDDINAAIEKIARRKKKVSDIIQFKEFEN